MHPLYSGQEVRSRQWQYSLNRKLRPCPFGTLFEPFKLDPDHGGESWVSQLGKSVINLSKYPLSDIEQNVLEKGLYFIPTPKNVIKIPIMEAASNFGLRLKIEYHFTKSKFDRRHEKNQWQIEMGTPWQINAFRYPRNYSKHKYWHNKADDFKERIKLLTSKLIKKWFTINRLTNTMKKCPGKHSWIAKKYKGLGIQNLYWCRKY